MRPEGYWPIDPTHYVVLVGPWVILTDTESSDCWLVSPKVGLVLSWSHLYRHIYLYKLLAVQSHGGASIEACQLAVN